MPINTCCALMHLMPDLFGLGIIINILIWREYRDDYGIVDQQGRAIFNGVINFSIYAFALAMIGVILVHVLIFIRFPFLDIVVIVFLLALLGMCITQIVFSVVGAVNAYRGEVWEYPFPWRVDIFKYGFFD